MKNELLFFYEINIINDNLTKINKNYYFSYQNNSFVIEEYIRNIDEIAEIYNLTLDMLNNKIITYIIIPTKNNQLLFVYEEKYYVLMILPNIKNRIITYQDIINFNYVIANDKFKKIDKSFWSYYWENKIDYLEYQFHQLENKYPLINQSINYYLGIWENAISYYNDNIIEMKELKIVCHKRLTSETDLLEFLNPLNFVIDYKERDLADYLKSFVYEEKYSDETIDKYLQKIPLNKNIVIRFISRLLFPTEYFDLYENIIYENYNEKILKKIIDNRNNYLFLLKSTFKLYGQYNIPIIEWIIKEKDLK